MALLITAHGIVSDTTPHEARRVHDTYSWKLSWLPDRRFSYDGTVAAMLAAEHLAENPSPDDRIWGHIETWMAQVGLDQSQWPWPDQTEQLGLLEQAEQGWS
jgi:hypothetical protein